jgi:dTDP-glucose pyrophosphorylase
MKKLSERIDRCCVREASEIVEAMRAIDDGAVGAALVLDKSRRLIGILTDGDIRRALLAGATMRTPILSFVNRQFTAVGTEEGRTYVLDLMQARHLSQIPIVDNDGKLIGLHLLREILGSIPRANWAVVMAGGKGTRLRPITENLPKPMIKVAGRPILERLVLHLVGFGIRRIFLSVNYLGHMIEKHFGDGSALGCKIEYLREEQEMGTGGALALLPELPDASLLVLNGDLVTQFNVDRLLAFHDRGGYAATIAVRRYFHIVPFGCLQVSDSQVQRFDEKPMLQQMINAGTYVLSPRIVKNIPKAFFPITDLFAQCLSRNEPLGACEIEEDWLDVGQKEQLKQAQEGIA